MIEEFGVVAQDVVDQLPSNTRLQASGTDGITNAKIAKWITEGAAILVALMERAGIDITAAAQSTSAARHVARSAIISYALIRCYRLNNRPDDPRLASLEEEWAEAKKVLLTTPTVVGNAKSPESGVVSTVNMGERRLTFRDNRW